ncbi:MAG: hypothetical protein PHI86_00320 [Candidatus Omnitrophica bacterium]|nr:hypothetical protein [Candidatus Omnitrophota bacterium]HOX54288.1 hypothetical protein [Candidatus Omnitrophota bacterium]
MKKFFTTLFVFLIIAFSIFSFFRYFTLLKINYSLEQKINEINTKIAELESTKKNLEIVLDKKKEEYLALSKENQDLLAKLQDTEKKLNDKNAELETFKKESQDATAKIESLNNEYVKLQEEIKQLQQEKETLQSKFNSLPELKEAYDILKKKLREAKLAQRKTKTYKEIKEEDGNKGFLLWQGEPTVAKKVKIEVAPVSE